MLHSKPLRVIHLVSIIILIISNFLCVSPKKDFIFDEFILSSFIYFLTLTNSCFAFFHCPTTTSLTPFMHDLSFFILWKLLQSLTNTRIILFREHFLGANAPSAICVLFSSHVFFPILSTLLLYRTSYWSFSYPLLSVAYHLSLNSVSSSWNRYAQVVEVLEMQVWVKVLCVVSHSPTPAALPSPSNPGT